MILVDSSAWVEFKRATGSPADVRLTEAIAASKPLATTGIILLELLSGAVDERHALELRRLLDRCRLLALEEPRTTRLRQRSTARVATREPRSADFPTA